MTYYSYLGTGILNKNMYVSGFIESDWNFE